MADTSSTISPTAEDYTLSASLNAAMLLNFLIGIYMMVYGGTVYLYCSRKPSKNHLNRRPVLLTLMSVPFTLAFVDFVLQWYLLNWSFVTQGATRETIFEAIVLSPKAVAAVIEFVQGFLLVLSSMLLIWRCYYLWDEEVRVVTAPLVLLVVQIALAITNTVLVGTTQRTLTQLKSDLQRHMTASLAFVSFGAAAYTSLLIAYKLHKTSSETRTENETRISEAWAACRRMSDAVVDSSSAVALVLLVKAVMTVIGPFWDLESPLVAAIPYVQAVLDVTTGMAPTIMIARLVVASAEKAKTTGTKTHVSRLDFIAHQATDKSTNITRLTQSQLTGSGGASDIADEEKAAVLDLKKDSASQGDLQT
ncbi:hypothetical protein JR316_0004153 [Psilocybe cubensis]|uniref:Uncharacterized protein n=2 Tax=Psilocybe cubensis TaxID=181762 RepID=A0ACB8H234_PSICU|nr:hypothetical protein JR316_0004153 [Psilocybe cubensis]KAH9482058.1 hypothetical protein JR316_0004153 [Psilocybe cubensis]